MKLKFWLYGVRLYIALGIVLVTLEIIWWATASYGTSRLAMIRMQEVYAWLALILLCAAIAIGPLLKIFPNIPGKQLFRDARRLVGVGAAWFATLHVGLSYMYLFDAVNPLRLATAYQQSFALGAAALIILLLMAFTSFDAAFKAMGVWWFRLHRLVYLAVLIAVLHAFMIGSHTTNLVVLIALLIFGICMTVAYAYMYFVRATPTTLQLITSTYLVIVAAAVLNYGLSQYLGYNILLDHTETSTTEHRDTPNGER